MNNFEIKSILSNKKYQWIAVALVFLAVVIFAVWVRTQNLPLLRDQTNGQWLSSDIDPFYFLRVAKTMLAGPLPEYDPFRNPALHVDWTHELLPRALVFMYKIVNGLGFNVPIELISIMSPVVFFVLGLIAFFFLIYYLTKSKGIALASSVFLSFIPIYLYRTTAGVGDHDPLGEATFFIALLAFAGLLVFLNKLDFSKVKTYVYCGIFSLGAAFLTAFAMAGQPGSSNFLFMIVPLSFLAFWLIKSQRLHREEIHSHDKKEFGIILGAYIIWAVFSALFFTIYGNSLNYSLEFVFSGSYGTINLGALAFIIVDFLILLFATKIPKVKKFRVVFTVAVLLILGIIIAVATGKNLASSSLNSLITVIDPTALDSNRIGATVAENAQPYLKDLINQIGSPLFWIFVFGVFMIGVFTAKEIKSRRGKIIYSISWIILTSSIFLTRYSSNSAFRGDNFISIATYILGGLLFLGASAWLYFKDEIRANPYIIIISAWAIFMLISARATQRIYFVIAPFICFISAYALFKTFDLARTRKEEISRIISWVLFAAIAVGLIFSLHTFVTVSSAQGKYVGPAANYQWQEAMNWTRANTPSDAIFVHWWDYGWWTQTLGERRTVTDGGHANGFWDHLVGRYLLTETRPEVSLSYMKSNNVSYLLLDPSDIGKYPAYSKIGSDASGTDRHSSIPTMLADPRGTTETANGTTRTFQGVSGLDSDIIYTQNGQTILLSKENSVLVGVIMSSSSTSISQPLAVFYANGQQIEIPIRYVFANGNQLDFGSGLDSEIMLFPYIYNTATGIGLDPTGGLIYLSSKTKDSLFVQLYLLNDVNHRYPTITNGYFAQDPVIQQLRSRGAVLPELVYYQGVRGPLKIWKVDYPGNILARDEFLQPIGDYASLDNLQFTK